MQLGNSYAASTAVHAASRGADAVRQSQCNIVLFLTSRPSEPDMKDSTERRSSCREKVTSPATAVLRALAALAVGLLGAAPLSPLIGPLEGMAGVGWRIGRPGVGRAALQTRAA